MRFAQYPSENDIFSARSRKTKILTWVCRGTLLRALISEPDAEIGEKDSFRSDTIYEWAPAKYAAFHRCAQSYMLKSLKVGRYVSWCGK